MPSLRFDFEWRTTTLVLLLLPALVALGFWQLDRAAEKAVIANRNDERAAARPMALSQVADLSPEALAYRRVEVTGRFLPEPVILLDNQIRDGRYGHDVVGVFVDAASGQAALLNRGWVPGDPSRRSLPDVETPDERLTLKASVYVPPGEPYLLERDNFATLPSTVLVQQVNSHELREAVASMTGYTLFPRELRLAPGEPAGFRRDWPVVNVSPDKHRGYALQWFTMAGALVLLFLARSSNLGELLRERRTH